MTNPNDPYSAFTGLDQRNGQVIESVYARGLSAREHAAIQLRVPNSGTPWLDEMIRQSLQQEFAKAAISGFMANKSNPLSYQPENDSEFVLKIADALLAELEKQP